MADQSLERRGPFYLIPSYTILPAGLVQEYVRRSLDSVGNKSITL